MLWHQEMPLGTLPFTERKILMGEVARLNTLDDLPPHALEERRHQATEGYLSRLGVPFRTKSGIQESIDLLSHARQVTWSDEDVSRLRMVGGAIAGVLERKLVASNQLKLLERNHAYLALVASQQHLANEVGKAADYVMSLLPAPISRGDITTIWHYAPSATLGGDSFGYHWIDKNHFAFYLLDVCGHGVGSALLSVSALNVLRSESLPNVDFCDPVAVLGGMNASFQMEKQNGLYFTLWYGVYNRQTRRLRHASAGHPPALLVGDSLPVTPLNSTNFFIGAFPKVDYEAAQIDIPPNSRLYLFSDGVYEVDRPDGTMWSFEQLQDFLSRQLAESGGEIDALYKILQEMHSSDVLDDDFSLLRVDFHSRDFSRMN
jgi:serine phosphatase RsbU (regulator of sigma subunit)